MRPGWPIRRPSGYNVRPTRGIAQPGSAPVWGTGGRRFESGYPDQYTTANPLCRVPKTPQIAGFSRFGCGLRSHALTPGLAKISPNSPSLSPALWTSRLSRPQDGFHVSLHIKDLRVVSGERFYGVNAYQAGYERRLANGGDIVVCSNATQRNPLDVGFLLSTEPPVNSQPRRKPCRRRPPGSSAFRVRPQGAFGARPEAWASSPFPT